MTNKNTHIPIVKQYARTYSDPPERVRVAARGVLIEDGKILLSYERNTDIYMSPGGGLEEGETLEECCVRELAEETGYKVKVGEEFITIHEYCFETLNISHYFFCEVLEQGQPSLTPTEIDHGIVAQWVEIEKAFEIFGGYDSIREDWRSLYRREFTVLNKILAE